MRRNRSTKKLPMTRSRQRSSWAGGRTGGRCQPRRRRNGATGRRRPRRHPSTRMRRLPGGGWERGGSKEAAEERKPCRRSSPPLGSRSAPSVHVYTLAQLFYALAQLAPRAGGGSVPCEEASAAVPAVARRSRACACGVLQGSSWLLRSAWLLPCIALSVFREFSLPLPRAQGYVTLLLRNGWDSVQRLQMLTEEDLQDLGIKRGHARAAAQGIAAALR